MMHTADSSLFLPKPLNRRGGRVGVGCVWTIREKRNGIIVSERKVKNLWTSYGLTALATGSFNPTNLYLAVENPGSTVSTTISAGSTSITASKQIHQAGDTEIVASVGLSNQETLTFSGATPGAGSTYIYTLSSATTQPHNAGEYICRQVNENDTVSNLVSEQQYDAVNFPNQRQQVSGNYSSGSGNGTYQFYYIGPTAQFLFLMVGMCDSPTIGTGNLLNHFVLGYNHNSTTNDLEIDGSLTLSNL